MARTKKTPAGWLKVGDRVVSNTPGIDRRCRRRGSRATGYESDDAQTLHNVRELTAEEFDQHFGNLPTDGEG
jgi:hypothetical protein